METKIVTIESIRFVGKWVEFLFKEEKESRDLNFDDSSKSSYFWDAVEKANLFDDIINNGIKGRKMMWYKSGPNWEIKHFVIPGEIVEVKEQTFWYSNKCPFIIKYTEEFDSLVEAKNWTRVDLNMMWIENGTSAPPILSDNHIYYKYEPQTLISASMFGNPTKYKTYGFLLTP